MEESPAPNAIHWRRDASTSRTVAVLWSLGAGTFFATIGIIVFWRLYDFAGQAGLDIVVAAVAAVICVSLLALALSADPGRHLARLAGPLPIEVPDEEGLDRARAAILGTLVVAALIGGLMAVGRYVSEQELLALGAGPFTGLAALLIPLALVALVLSSFLRSVGALDPDDRSIYLYDPDQRVDLDVIDAVSVRRIGDAAIVRLSYAQPDGQYVAGPRRVVVPSAVAAEIERLVG